MAHPLLNSNLEIKILAGLLALFAVPINCAQATELFVTSATTYPELTKALRATNKGWIGGDGAYSVPLDDSITLWTFGDTWIGKIEGNKRSRNSKMLNNTAAIQKLGGEKIAPLSFKWLSNKREPSSLWVPSEDGSYFWPGDGITIDGKLFLFLHKITTDKSRPEPFQFRTVSDSVVKVDNPCESPMKWKMTYADLGNDAEKLEYGTATIDDGKHIFVCVSNQTRRNGLDAHPAILARVPRDDFSKLNFKNIEYFKEDNTNGGSTSENEGTRWNKDSNEASLLFRDAAPEMSLTRVKGIPGFIAVYMPPLSKEIYIRHAMSPEGPWSDRIKIYDCPEKEDGILLYSAKAHQELAREPCELIVTYCRNSKDNEMHYKDASIYFPQAIRVQLKWQ